VAVAAANAVNYRDGAKRTHALTPIRLPVSFPAYLLVFYLELKGKEITMQQANIKGPGVCGNPTPRTIPPVSL
jgi:hypothetical protein